MDFHNLKEFNMTEQEIVELLEIVLANPSKPNFTKQQYESSIKERLAKVRIELFDENKFHTFALIGNALNRFDEEFYGSLIILGFENTKQRSNPIPDE